MDDESEALESSGSESGSSDSDCEEWIIYRGKESLNAFLEKNRPSRLSNKDASWISVSAPKVQRVQDGEEQGNHKLVRENEQKQQPDEYENHTDEEQEDKLHNFVQKGDGEDKRQIVEQKQQNKQQEHEVTDTETEQSKCKEQEGEQKDDRKLPTWLLWAVIKREWKILLKNKHNKMVTSETLKELALKYGYTTGKWLIFASSKYIDGLWFTIAKAVMAGKLGIATKVSTKNPEERTHVICVYTENFTNEDDVRRVEKSLRDLGIYGKMSYKADIYTILGIYIHNDLGISPTIFKSEAVHASGDHEWREETGKSKGHKVQHVDCIRYDGKESLDSFIESNRPSMVDVTDVHWISVSYQHDDYGQCRDMPFIKAEWKEQQKKRGITMFGAEVLKELAKKYRYTSGKWMIFTKRYEVDDLWYSIAKAVNAGRLGNEAKVSTKKINEDHVIFVYTKDFTDEPDVRRVERSLRTAGVGTRMSYKPDIYTSLGISAKNDFGISPTVFTSKAVNYRSDRGYRY